MSLEITTRVLLAVLAGVSASGCGGGGGGGGDSSPEAQTAAAIASLDESALAGSVTDEEFATRLDELLAAVDGREDGALSLSLYYEEHVVGADLMAGAVASHRAAAKTAQQTIDDIKNSETYQMLEAFVSSVASNLLIPDPANTLLAFADPEVFLASASVTIRAQIFDALVNGQITPEQAQSLYELGRQNPWEAKRALLVALSQTPPAWVDTLATSCLRDCGPTGDTTVYAGPFHKVFSTSGGGCTWQENLSGTIEVVVTGTGTVSDPFEGTMDVTGSWVETLTAGADCDPGGTFTISSFDGTAFGNDGKLYGEGDGVIGIGTFYAAINGATITSTSVTGQFEFQVGDETLLMPVTLSN
jgi:hypothetical protein